MRGPLRLDTRALGIAVLLSLLSGMYAYLEDEALNVSELVFLLAVFYVCAHVARWAWARVRSSRRGRE
jgi:hypothetical protein